MGILKSFIAFNTNAFNSIVYNISSNVWLLLTLVSVTIIVLLSLKNAIDITVREEQNIL